MFFSSFCDDVLVLLCWLNKMSYRFGHSTIVQWIFWSSANFEFFLTPLKVTKFFGFKATKKYKGTLWLGYLITCLLSYSVTKLLKNEYLLTCILGYFICFLGGWLLRYLGNQLLGYMVTLEKTLLVTWLLGYLVTRLLGYSCTWKQNKVFFEGAPPVNG